MSYEAFLLEHSEALLNLAQTTEIIHYTKTKNALNVKN